MSASSNASFDHNKETTLAVLDRTQSNSVDVNEDFLDDDLDFLEDEPEEEVVQVADPLSPWNRIMFHFNDKFYFWLLKPVARGYRAVTPKPVRNGVQNFFYNLATPIRMASCILQGKVRKAWMELASFLTNSTAGVLGFLDPAKKYPMLNTTEEDLGQALASYGIGNGFYIVWPILGSSTLRDSVGIIGDWFLYPVTYVRPFGASMGIKTVDAVNQTSLRIGDYESLKDAALEPYEAFRNAYIQYRKKKVME
ncbi:MAG: hypothetical protein BA872_07000 [Desulfobacterales bacterium C00003060]|nr:MAG: hypothetical protein BA861_08610 [Desulfobacterales bacterium S3730MH5]OEU76771.1 MAG: hypothetical protein BA872_07000 [Desulfobacterales bacterium C00003060]OEU84946.1 MAG: hypothetical protein BA865_07405 [Desulfobacterales bacterium S5133MH4]